MANREANGRSLTVSRVVAAVVALCLGLPLTYYGSIMGADVGAKAAQIVGPSGNGNVGFIVGSVAGVAVGVLATGVAVYAARAVRAITSRRQ